MPSILEFARQKTEEEEALDMKESREHGVVDVKDVGAGVGVEAEAQQGPEEKQGEEMQAGSAGVSEIAKTPETATETAVGEGVNRTVQKECLKKWSDSDSE